MGTTSSKSSSIPSPIDRYTRTLGETILSQNKDAWWFKYSEKYDGSSHFANHLLAVCPDKNSFEESVSIVDQILTEDTNSSRNQRIGLIGSLAYYGSSSYTKRETQELTKTAAKAVASNKRFRALILGGNRSSDSPQGNWAQAFEDAGIPVVYVVPNCTGAQRDLERILYDIDGSERPLVKGQRKIIFAGRSYPKRNQILASLCSQYAVAAGGPGTRFELFTSATQQAGNAFD